jgi:hypothetical protein
MGPVLTATLEALYEISPMDVLNASAVSLMVSTGNTLVPTGRLAVNHLCH